MARIHIGDSTFLFPLDQQEGRFLASVLLDTVGRSEEARLLKMGRADVQFGQIIYRVRDGWRVRVNIQRSAEGNRRGIIDVTMPPDGVVEYETTCSEASGDGSDAALLWLCLCAVSSPAVRMDPETLLRWVATIRCGPGGKRDAKKAASKRLLLELADSF